MQRWDEIGCGECFEDFCSLSGAFFVVDDGGGEEFGVELSTDGVAGAGVGLASITEQGDGFVGDVVEPGDVVGLGLELCDGLGFVGSDALLFLPEQVGVDGVFVVQFQQLFELTVGFEDLAGDAVQLGERRDPFAWK